jgi:hypothetical protein
VDEQEIPVIINSEPVTARMALNLTRERDAATMLTNPSTIAI